MKPRRRWAIAVAAILLVAAAAFWFFGTSDQTPPPAAAVALDMPAKSAPTAVLVNQPRPPVPAPAPPPQIGDAGPIAPQTTADTSAPAPRYASNYPGFGPAPDPSAFVAAPLAPEQRVAITNNLRQLFSAAQQYMLDKSSVSTSYSDLVGTGPDFQLHTLTPVAGEDYSGITISQTTTEIPIVTPSGDTVLYNQ